MIALMQDDNVPPCAEKRRLLLNDAVFYEILFALGVSAHDRSDYCAWEHINFSRMGHARVLYNFFETSGEKRRQDDVLSEDFGFPASPINLPASDKDRLNKDLFHLTYARLRHTDSTKPWPDTILSYLHGRCVEFINHILSNPDGLIGEQNALRWKELLELLKSEHELLIFRSFRGADMDHKYRLTHGQHLPSGLSELTKPVPIN